MITEKGSLYSFCFDKFIVYIFSFGIAKVLGIGT
jgi:hypothetical protein